MKRKVGVLTFQGANNYGAVLQAFALQIALKNSGVEPELFDYHSKAIEKPIFSFNPKQLLSNVLQQRKKKRFVKFYRKNIAITKRITKYKDLVQIQRKYDFVIAGSDQVFNPQWNKNDDAYYLSFCPDDKKYSYSASFGKTDYSDTELTVIKGFLSRFNSLSIREDSGLELLSRMNLNGMTHIDPTLLFSKSEWERYAKEPKTKGYMLIYSLENNPDMMQFAIKIAKKRNLRVLQISDTLKNKAGMIEYVAYAGIEKFLGLFLNADCIVTNSFHGLVFSTIFEKSFVLFPQIRKNAPNSRLFDFVNRYGLQEAVFNAEKQDIKMPDYQRFKSKVGEDKDVALKYLSSFASRRIAKEKRECNYCSACINVCPTSAISFRKDAEGFKYPWINVAKCIDCGACESVCPYLSPEVIKKQKNVKTIAFKNADDNERMNSRSGGLFYVIAKSFIEQEGIVYGAVIDLDGKVKHIRGTKMEDIQAMQKSKYVQSDFVENSFKMVADDLNDGKKVFYSGTPCIVNGLLSLLDFKNVNRTNLITMDIVCHGVTSPMIFEDYYYATKKKYGAVSSFQFRDKEKGWHTHIESFTDGKGEKIFKNEYANVFYSHIAQRSACYNCLYTSYERVSDITGADLWGGYKLKDFFDDRGVSLCLINSEKGLGIYDRVLKSGGLVKEINIEDFKQPLLLKSIEKPNNRQQMWSIYYQKSYQAFKKPLISKVNAISRKNRLKGMIVFILRKLKLKK